MTDAGKTQLSNPSQLKSDIWNPFGFNTTQEKVLDKNKVVCKICRADVSYCRYTTNLRNQYKVSYYANISFRQQAVRGRTKETEGITNITSGP